MLNCFAADNKNATPVFVVNKNQYQSWLKKQPETTQAWLSASGFRGEAGAFSCIPGVDGKVVGVICTAKDANSLWSVGSLPMHLPEGDYRIEVDSEQSTTLAIGWGLGAYQFAKYKQSTRKPANLCLPQDIKSHAENMVSSLHMVRDWINTPTEDMGPSQMATAVAELAKEFDASFSQVVGKDLLKQDFNAIYTVGRASDDEPRLLDLRWGDAKHPKLTLVGKGVCFDTGGLDIKPTSGMLLMKKDMGGAAHVFGLARMIMAAKLPVCLRVLVPSVENSIAGNAYRPGDVIKSKKGLTVEIGNTDAEGRLVLADALTEAVSENPALLIDIATLTGAARVALGTQLPALFSDDDDLANGVLKHGEQVIDPLWRLPMFAMYREYLNSNIADINNNASEPYGGAITAALFLKEFVPDNISWMHLDMMAWNLRALPGRPRGGEAMALRALFGYLQETVCLSYQLKTTLPDSPEFMTSKAF